MRADGANGEAPKPRKPKRSTSSREAGAVRSDSAPRRVEGRREGRRDEKTLRPRDDSPLTEYLSQSPVRRSVRDADDAVVFIF